MYEATRVGIDRKVALKILHSKYAKSAKIVKRFHQEARLAGSIEHDNICRVTDHGSAESGAPYLVMPLLTGRSLAKWLESGEPLSQMRVIDIACQTLLALEAAHNERIVHRDLKPDNIFVTRMGDREDFVKLLDFGISKVLEQKSASDLTSTGMVLGTAYYLAPEQARGAKKIDQRVDIYAMGVILYEALTGQRPFEGDTYNEVMFKIAGEPFKPPRSLNPAISPAVEQVIIRAMAIDPADRYHTAIEMCDALENAAVSSIPPTDSLAETLADDAAPVRTGHNTRTRTLLGLIITTAIAAGIVLWWTTDDENDTADVHNGESSGTSPQPNPSTVTALPEMESEAASTSVSMPVPDAPASDPPDRGDTAAGAGSDKVSPATSIDTGKAPKVEPSEPAKRRRPADKKMIRGRNRTTFVFDE